jgi:hypothetical protein
MRVNKVRISILAFTFLAGIVRVPDFVYNNFWNKSFWEALPFTFNYGYFRFIYAVLLTICVELMIRFFKKYA